MPGLCTKAKAADTAVTAIKIAPGSDNSISVLPQLLRDAGIAQGSYKIIRWNSILICDIRNLKEDSMSLWTCDNLILSEEIIDALIGSNVF